MTELQKNVDARKRIELTALTQSGAVLATVFDPQPPRLPNGRPARKPAPPAQPARYQNGAWELLPIPSGADRSLAGDINERGDVVGVSVLFRRGKPSYNRVVLYPAGGALIDVGTMDPKYADADTDDFTKMRGVGELGTAINNAGAITAYVGDRTWLRDVGGNIRPFPAGNASDLNDGSGAVGTGLNNTGTPLLWRDAFASSPLPPVPLLPTQRDEKGQEMPVLRGAVQSMNNKNAVVFAEVVERSTSGRRQGVTAYYLLQNKRIQHIGNFGGFQRFRARVNDRNDVVGFLNTDYDLQIYRPYLYRDGELFDLTDTVAKTGWRIAGAIDVNNRGQILAYGVRVKETQPGADSAVMPLLLTPTATPAPKSATAPRPN